MGIWNSVRGFLGGSDSKDRRTCPVCGRTYSKDTRFCSKDGAALDEHPASYDAFISYRRTAGSHARVIRLMIEQLSERKLFLDVDELDAGRFDERLLGIIESVSSFILVLSPGCLDRCVNPEDWLRREILHAMAHGKNIIPVMVEGFSFPSATSMQSLPPQMRELSNYQAVEYLHDHAESSVRKILRYMSQPVLPAAAPEPPPAAPERPPTAPAAVPRPAQGASAKAAQPVPPLPVAPQSAAPTTQPRIPVSNAISLAGSLASAAPVAPVHVPMGTTSAPARSPGPRPSLASARLDVLRSLPSASASAGANTSAARTAGRQPSLLGARLTVLRHDSRPLSKPSTDAIPTAGQQPSLRGAHLTVLRTHADDNAPTPGQSSSRQALPTILAATLTIKGASTHV